MNGCAENAHSTAHYQKSPSNIRLSLLHYYAKGLRPSHPPSSRSYSKLCWLLGTSVQKIGILRLMEQASLPKLVRGEYSKQQGPCCLYSSSNAPIFTKERFNSCCVYSPPSNNVSVSALSFCP